MSRYVTKKTLFAVLIGLLAIGIIIWTLSAFVFHKDADRPAYPTLLPANTSIADLGGWQRVSPPDKDPVFAYIDHIKDTPISVSQQPLPSTFKQDPAGQTAELAKSFNAIDTLDIEGMTVYIGTSIKGPQSIIFTKKNLLVLIKSESTISHEAWTNYIRSLR